MTLNTNKTQIMIINKGNANSVCKSITYKNQTILCSENLNILGIYFSKNLKWNTHINYIYNKARKHLFILHRLKNVFLKSADPGILCIGSKYFGVLLMRFSWN